MKITKNTLTVKATESSWMRKVKFQGDVVAVTKLATRKTAPNRRRTDFWAATPEAWEAFKEAVSNMGDGDSIGRIFNSVFQPLQGTEEARAAIEAAKASV